ncbi:hypothetical protein CEXT_111131 [Caerostris extrusa]|uniref:Uncharacterized protein n=1 Tax=Caerostris extrusa TaxID=172846 RepID=A0AAV4MVG2_CAEEX|nr:hypothetical protein CEXT_111131 [Caerostris extrusa]
MECVALSPSSSHFITDGKYTRFADWRFIHKARLNLGGRNNGSLEDRSVASALQLMKLFLMSLITAKSMKGSLIKASTVLSITSQLRRVSSNVTSVI